MNGLHTGHCIEDSILNKIDSVKRRITMAQKQDIVPKGRAFY